MLEVALTIPYWLELAATVSGAIFGAMSAVRARYDIFGVCCISIVVGLAGGMLRDVLLQDYGIYAFQNPNLIMACIITGVVVFYFGKLVTYFDPAVDFLDNLSVALWAVIGTGKAMSAGLDIVPAAILGTMTANGGGIMRDICMNREPEAFQAGTLYVSAALLGCVVYALMRENHVLDGYAGVTCIVLVLAVRYAAIIFGWRTRPARDYTDVVVRPVRSVVRHVKPVHKAAGKLASGLRRDGGMPPASEGAARVGDDAAAVPIAQQAAAPQQAAASQPAAAASPQPAAAAPPDDKVG